MGFLSLYIVFRHQKWKVDMRIQRYASNLMAAIMLVGCARIIGIEDLPDIPDDERLDAMVEIPSVDAAPAELA
jgi:hypothetical protein